MKNITRNLLLLDILLSGTQCIVVPWLPLSLFQISILATIIVSIRSVISHVFSNSGVIYKLFAIIWFISGIIAYLTSVNNSWANSYVLLSIMTSFLFLAIPCHFRRDDLRLLIKTLIRSQYIVIPFSLVNYYIFYSIGAMPEKLPLFWGLYVNLDADTIARGTAAGELRLMLPYATPPVLSIVMATCLTVLLFSKRWFMGIEKWFLIFSYGLILIFTGSRTGMLGFVMLLMLLMINGDLKKYLKSIPKLRFIFLSFGIVFLLLSFIGDEYFQKMVLGRFSGVSSNSLEDDRHFLVPLDGLLIWVDDLSNFVLGIGFGSSSFMKGYHTYLPPYFLNSYVTLLAERGLLGLILCCTILCMLFTLYRRRMQYCPDERAMLYGLFVTLFSGIFYENLICYFVIFTISISFILFKSKVYG